MSIASVESMWRPPDSANHPPPPARWTPEEYAQPSRPLAPLHRAPLSLASRTRVSTMAPWRATGDGLAAAAVVEWYKRFAAGQPGGLAVAATGAQPLTVLSDRALQTRWLSHA